MINEDFFDNDDMNDILNNAIDLNEVDDSEQMNEGCPAGAPPPPPPAGGPGPGPMPPPPPGHGIQSDVVLGPTPHSHGKGWFGPGDFHIPFPVMPMLYRYGWTTSKKKAKKNAKKYKNPYANGAKFITMSEDETAIMHTYEDKALENIKSIVVEDECFVDVLHFNGDHDIAWKVTPEFYFRAYRPFCCNGRYCICEVEMQDDGMVKKVSECGDFTTYDEAKEALKTNAEEQQQKLEKVVEEC